MSLLDLGILILVEILSQLLGCHYLSLVVALLLFQVLEWQLPVVPFFTPLLTLELVVFLVK
jgi:hypothetical protein